MTVNAKQKSDPIPTSHELSLDQSSKHQMNQDPHESSPSAM